MFQGSFKGASKQFKESDFFGDTLQDLEIYIVEFLKFCKEKTLKLKMSKFKISEQLGLP